LVQDLQQLFWEEDEVMRHEYRILDRAFETMLKRIKAVRAAKNTRGLFP
jgi:glutamate dehydrogenase (NAD(P)+)